VIQGISIVMATTLLVSIGYHTQRDPSYFFLGKYTTQESTFLTAVEIADCVSSLWVTHLVSSLLEATISGIWSSAHTTCHVW